jgi:hypothetical protein
MTVLRARHRPAGRTAQGIDRVVRNVATGHFERSLSALTAAGALVTAMEIYFEHDRASFGNKTLVGGMGLLAAILRREKRPR